MYMRHTVPDNQVSRVRVRPRVSLGQFISYSNVWEKPPRGLSEMQILPLRTRVGPKLLELETSLLSTASLLSQGPHIERQVSRTVVLKLLGV